MMQNAQSSTPLKRATETILARTSSLTESSPSSIARWAMRVVT